MELEEFIGLYDLKGWDYEQRDLLTGVYEKLRDMDLTESMTEKQARGYLSIYRMIRELSLGEGVERGANQILSELDSLRRA